MNLFSKKINYRPEIDGLRAIAVVAVIFYHAQITIFDYKIFKGGFIGVDIFFIVSGYLITLIILKEFYATGNFSFKYFYQRRARRILPLLFFVILISSFFAWKYLLPMHLVDFSKSVFYLLGFSSNFYFHYSVQYGSENALLKPLLHTWSLSVEEQYYILFPAVIWIVFKYFKKYFFHIFFLVFFLNIFLNQFSGNLKLSYPYFKNIEDMQFENGSVYFSFYFLTSRIWELIAGSILAYSKINNYGRASDNKNLNKFLITLGFFLLLHAIFFFNDQMFHPSFYTLSPVIGSCLIIWFSEKDQIITKILSSKFFVGIGLISYSLYLWHYPIFAFARIKDKDLSQYDKFSLIVLITILSIISFYLIEKPMRNKRTKFRTVLYFLLIILFFVTSFNYFSIKSNGLKNRLPFVLKNIFVDNQAPWELLKDFNGKLCYENKNFCFFNKNSNKKVFLIGDSQMAVLSYDLKSRLVSKNYQFVTSVFGDCLYFPGFDRVEIKAKKIAENCNNEYFLKLENLLNNNNDSIIIFGGMFPKYLTNELFNNKKDVNQKIIWNQKFIRVDKFEDIQSSFISSVNKLTKNNKIILIYPIPEFDRNISQEVFNQYSEDFLYFKKKINNFSISYDLYKIRTKSSFEMLDSIKGKNVYRVYPDRLFCDSLIKNRCIANDNKNVFYFDENHQSIIGAELINNLIVREIQKIEKE